ncbi:UDP-glucuronosyltransferase 1A1-like [Physella acuta]|uniref:UDP-glucuronosyltransferase 1A1-like n=1 Tax=Physella acuta TaxID=109671 RepID=UPI0027DD9931|nr:UDP-glucuronosyltransferase 1A1-like [Physella acuta]
MNCVQRVSMKLRQNCRNGQMLKAFLLYILIADNFLQAYSKRVVVVPMPNVSHTRYLTNVARALTTHGHEAWVCMPVSVAEQSVFNMTGIHVLEYSKREVNVVEDYMRYVRDAYWKDESVDMERMMSILFDHMQMMMEDAKLEAAIREIKPDLMILDNLPHMRTIAVMAYKLGIPFAFVGPLYDPVPYRVPFTTATFPSSLFPHTDSMNFQQRLTSFLIHSVTVVFELFGYTDAVRRYAPEKPYLPVRQLTSQAEIVLIESDPIMDYPKVGLPNVKLIGGTAVTQAVELVEPFKTFVENATSGVVVVSFGTYIVDLPAPIYEKMVSAFRRLNLRVVWRVSEASPDPQQILTSTWIPQNDLLGHPNVKVFVTHCGQSSQYEALFHAVPTLCIPIFMDQTYNAERARSKGYGLTVDLKKATSDEIYSNIMEMYTNSTYKLNVQKASKLFKLNYGLPMNKAAFWLDHVMKHGGSYMRSAGQNMPGYQFFCIDLMLCLAVFLLVLCLVMFLIFRSLVRNFIKCLSIMSKCVQNFLDFLSLIYYEEIQVKAKLY